MNPLSPEAVELKACPPKRVDNPSYTAQIPHRFGTFFGLAGDGFQTGSVIMYGEWAREESLLLESLIRPGDWVLDVGANTGSMTMAFANSVRWSPASRVFSFEPQLFPFNCLVANIAANSLSHCVLPMRVAVGKEVGEIACPVLDPRIVNNFGGCSLADPAAHNGQVEQVPMVTIDSMNLPACHLIKADVEGMEPDVLEGAFQTISRFRPIIWTEQLEVRVGSKADLLKIFEDHQYKAWHVVTPIYSPRNIRNCPTNLFQFPGGQPMVDTNVLAIPEEMEPPPFITSPHKLIEVLPFE